MRDLTIQDIETIIRSDENRILEVKKTTGEIDAGMSSGCAFLNTDGGWLLFGIAPKSLKILGQDVTDPTKQEIANHLRKFDPLINPYVQYVDVPESDGKKVIAIYFDPAEYSDVPYSYDGRPYYKVENTTTLMPRQLFERLIRENHPEKFSWEKEICHKAILEDLDAKRIRGTIQAGVNVGRIPSSALQLQDVPAQLAHFKIGGEKDGIHNAAVKSLLDSSISARSDSHDSKAPLCASSVIRRSARATFSNNTTPSSTSARSICSSPAQWKPASVLTHSRFHSLPSGKRS